MATKILFAPRQSDAVLEIARSLTPAGFELLIAESARPEFYAAAAAGRVLPGPRPPDGRRVLPVRAQAQAGAAALSAGYDRVDIEAARKAGVPVSNNGGANAIAVAEHTHHADARRAQAGGALPQRRGGRQVAGRRTSTTSASTSWRGKTLGIVGLGNIGKKVARRAAAFDMTGAVLRHRPAHRGPGGRARRPLRAAARAVAHLGRGEPARAARRRDPEHDGRARVRPDEAGRDPRSTPAGARWWTRTRSTRRSRAARSRRPGLDVLVEEPPATNHPLFALPTSP